MTAPSRIACVNPACRRTGPAEHFADADIICAKCWKLLPPVLSARYRQLRRRENKLLKLIERRVLKDAIDPDVIDRIEHAITEQAAENWQLMRDYFRVGKKPLGLEGFLQEMGL